MSKVQAATTKKNLAMLCLFLKTCLESQRKRGRKKDKFPKGRGVHGEEKGV